MVMIVALICGTIFGIFYVIISSRNRERLALIEKGADASIFVQEKTDTIPIWKVVTLNFSFILMGIGVGIFTGLLIHHNFDVDGDVIYPAAIFLLAGIGLLTSFKMINKLEKNN